MRLHRAAAAYWEFTSTGYKVVQASTIIYQIFFFPFWTRNTGLYNIYRTLSGRVWATGTRIYCLYFNLFWVKWNHDDLSDSSTLTQAIKKPRHTPRYTTGEDGECVKGSLVTGREGRQQASSCGTDAPVKGGRGGKSYLFGGEEGRRGGNSYKAIGTHIRYFQLCRIGPRVGKQENRQARAGRNLLHNGSPTDCARGQKENSKPPNYPSVTQPWGHTHRAVCPALFHFHHSITSNCVILPLKKQTNMEPVRQPWKR